MQKDDENDTIDSSTTEGIGEETMNSMKMHQGSIRRAHFKNGGSLKQWNGANKVDTDRKKEESKTRCRKKVNEDE